MLFWLFFGSWPVVAPVIVQREEYSQIGQDCNCNVDARVVSIEIGVVVTTGLDTINSTPQFDLKEIGTTHPRPKALTRPPKIS